MVYTVKPVYKNTHSSAPKWPDFTVKLSFHSYITAILYCVVKWPDTTIIYQKIINYFHQLTCSDSLAELIIMMLLSLNSELPHQIGNTRLTYLMVTFGTLHCVPLRNGLVTVIVCARWSTVLTRPW